MRLIGLDPGLRKTGWGVIDLEGTHLTHVANGVIATDAKRSLAERLLQLHQGIDEIISSFDPEEAAVENTFVNKDPVSTLKLGQARAMSLLVPAQRGIGVFEYAPNQVKKTVVGVGHANKDQISAMVARLLPRCDIAGPDAADALAVAICHAHSRGSDRLTEALLKSQA